MFLTSVTVTVPVNAPSPETVTLSLCASTEMPRSLRVFCGMPFTVTDRTESPIEMPRSTWIVTGAPPDVTVAVCVVSHGAFASVRDIVVALVTVPSGIRSLFSNGSITGSPITGSGRPPKPPSIVSGPRIRDRSSGWSGNACVSCPSTNESSIAVTCTVCATFQFAGVKCRRMAPSAVVALDWPSSLEVMTWTTLR